jgi:hypothetical protein
MTKHTHTYIIRKVTITVTKRKLDRERPEHIHKNKRSLHKIKCTHKKWYIFIYIHLRTVK